MKRKITCILVCTVLIVSFIPMAGISISLKNKNSDVTVNYPDGLYSEKHSITPNSIKNYYITRNKMIEIAEAYTNHEWYPTEDNIFQINDTPILKYLENFPLLELMLYLLFDIKWVVTPDRDTYPEMPEWWGWKAGEKNIGVPYQWGGYSSISGFGLANPEDFDEQYTGTGEFTGNIHYAGDINCNEFVTSKACGVDCSGFVSRCWNLLPRQSTRTLGDSRHSWPITFDQLKKGDILNKYNYHVMLFNEFVDENKSAVSIYHSSGWDWKVNEKVFNVTNISEDGFSVTLEGSTTYDLYRYNPIKVLVEDGGIVIEIINIEEVNLSEVNWSVSITGGILNRINHTVFGVIPTIESGDIEQIGPISLFGFGKILITVSATISSYGPIQKIRNGLVIGKQLVLF